MEGELLTQIGVGGILVVLVLREVFGFLKPLLEKRRTNGNGNGGHKANGHMSAETVAQVHELHRIMSKTDTDGTPLVYFPRSLAAAVQELAHATSEQNTLLERLNDNVSEARREIRQKTHQHGE